MNEDLDMYVRVPPSPGSIAGVPSSQALPSFLITAPPSVCVPDVIGALAVWIQNQKKVSDSFPVFIFFPGQTILLLLNYNRYNFTRAK